VVLDLMIHDLDIVLTCTGELPTEVRAAGISVLSPLVDIANVRLSFPSGCVANLTASRISTEKVRKLRLFQPGEYISVDYQRQDAVRLAVLRDELSSNGKSQIGGGALPVTPGEPLRLELEEFVSSVRNRTTPLVTAAQAVSALSVAETIVAKIGQHAQVVKKTLGLRSKTSRP
jgi:predicted dehydrogenase